MLKTKSIISSINEVPREWVFEFYLQLSEELTGQEIKMTSPLNPTEKNPSFFVYYAQNKKRYMFKDFSTDHYGDGTELVKQLFSFTTRGESAHKIIEDYNKYLSDGHKHNQERIIKKVSRYRVSGYSLRSWNELDKKYWTGYKIGTMLLKTYNVKPIKKYVMSRKDDAKTQKLVITGNRIYGYFKMDDTLYKIYLPESKRNKFIKVKEYIQGMNQLTFAKPYLIICSSLKDMMCFNKLNFRKIETIAPDSENTMIREDFMKALMKRYKAVCTLFDNDTPGEKAMRKYKEKFDIPYIKLNIEKDVADCVKEHGITNTKIHLKPLIIKALKEVLNK